MKIVGFEHPIGVRRSEATSVVLRPLLLRVLRYVMRVRLSGVGVGDAFPLLVGRGHH